MWLRDGIQFFSVILFAVVILQFKTNPLGKENNFFEPYFGFCSFSLYFSVIKDFYLWIIQWWGIPIETIFFTAILDKRKPFRKVSSVI